MSSSSQHPQQLTSADMGMVMRVHIKACAKNRIAANSVDAERIAALWVRNFQRGLSNQADLLTTFTEEGVLRMSMPVGRMDQLIGNAWQRIAQGGKSMAIPFPIDYPSPFKEPIA